MLCAIFAMTASGVSFWILSVLKPVWASMANRSAFGTG
jgi:hypothetical protein